VGVPLACGQHAGFKLPGIARLWSITVTAARERCHHYTASRLKNFQPDSTYIKESVDIRKAEAKVEMLKAR
jgi:hypothetical protein